MGPLLTSNAILVPGRSFAGAFDNDDDRDLLEKNSEPEEPSSYYWDGINEEEKQDWACWSFGVGYRKSQFGFLEQLQEAARQGDPLPNASPVHSAHPDRFWRHLFHDLCLAREMARFMPHVISGEEGCVECCPIILQPPSFESIENEDLLFNEWRDTPDLSVYDHPELWDVGARAKHKIEQKQRYGHFCFEDRLMLRDSRRLYLVPEPGNKYLQTILYFLRIMGANTMRHLIYSMTTFSPQLFERLFLDEEFWAGIWRSHLFPELASNYFLTCADCREENEDLDKEEYHWYVH